MADADAATAVEEKTVRLQVAAARQEESGQGIARMPRSAFQALGITEGDVVEITGKRATAAIAMAAYDEDQSLDVVRLDGLQRGNAQVGSGEHVNVVVAESRPATRVVFAPAQREMRLQGPAQALKRNFFRKPLVAGDLVATTGQQPVQNMPPEVRRMFNAPAYALTQIRLSVVATTPKGIVHSHQMRWRQFAATAASWLENGLPVRTLASTPLYSNTTMVAFLPALLAGGTVRVMRKFDVLRWLEWAQADAATITMLVPVQYRRLMQEPRFDEFDLSSLQLKYCTSAPFPAELKREVLARMPGALIEIYSMTEGGVVCLLEAHKFPDKLHTVGRPAPGSELKVLDDGDRPVAPGEAGNLIGRSQTMMAGYKNQPDKTREGYWTDPETGEVWQRMGDIGRVDAEGFVELVGRAKDMIISGGFNIFPVDLEDELAKEDDVIEAAVIGMPSERWGETPVGFVTLAEGARDCEDIRAAVNARLGKTQRLAQLHPIAEMPRSHIGKLLKTDLREEAARRGVPA